MRFYYFILLFFGMLSGLHAADETAPEASSLKSAYVIPIQGEINKNMFFLVRRNIKEAMAKNTDVIILDMKTPGGELQTTLDILDVLEKFPGETVTFVNNQAISAGAFISVGTKSIYMSERSVIGASAPVTIGIGGAAEIPDTMKKKVVSMIKAQMRACCQKYGHNEAVIEAMIEPDRELIIGDQTISLQGELLTLTNEEAAKLYDSKPLLSKGTVADMNELFKILGVNPNRITYTKKTRLESFGGWVSSFSAILILVGGLCLFIEFKTPGFGFFGITGIVAFAILFLGNYAAGLGGLIWPLIFLLGLILIGLEIFLLPGTLLLAISGALIALFSLIMGMTNYYPKEGLNFFKFQGVQEALFQTALGIFLFCVAATILLKYFPQMPLLSKIVSQGSSSETFDTEMQTFQTDYLGKEGVTTSVLRPGGKARFGNQVLDVIARDGMLAQGVEIQVVGYSGTDPIVAPKNQDKKG